MTILFLDLATVTGWAIDSASDDGKPVTGLCSLPDAVEMRVGHTLERYRTWLSSMVVRHEPRLIGYEEPVLLPRKSNFVLIALAGVTQMVAHQHGTKYEGVYLGTIKKEFTGRGDAKKPEMVARCRQIGWDVGGDHNRADAAAGWAYFKARDPNWRPNMSGLFTDGPRRNAR